MEIGFIGLGNMGQPMARRLIDAGHRLVVYDTRNDATAPLIALGAQLAGGFSKVRTVVWFDTNKETDWRVDSSAAALRAFRAIL